MSGEVSTIADRLRRLRERARLSQKELAERLGLDKDLISGFEEGVTIPEPGMLLAILDEISGRLLEVVEGVGEGRLKNNVERRFRAEPDDGDLLLRFPYGKYDATYRLPDASLEQFEGVLSELRGGLARLVSCESAESEKIKGIKLVD